MADHHVLNKVHSLSDVELACLLSLIGNEHCMISTPAPFLDDLTAELQLISDRTFGLKSAVVECTEHTTLDEFASSLLLNPHQPPSPTATRSYSPYLSRTGHDSYFPASNAFTQHVPAVQHYTINHHGGHPSSPTYKQPARSPTPQTPGGRPHTQIANIIIAKNLDRAPKAVQIQALELLRTKRIFTRTSVQTAPKIFMLVAVLGADSGGEARVTEHLNDFYYLAHWVDPEEEGFPLLDGDNDSVDVSDEEGEDDGGDDRDDASVASTASVVKRRSRSIFRSPKSAFTAQTSQPSKAPVFSSTDISSLRQLSLRVSVDIDITRYQMNIISFLRMHRAVVGGIGPQATRHFEQLMKCLAPLHGLDYVTPPLVCLAARKVYLHRIKMAEPSRERSTQWGSEVTAIERLLEGWGPEDVVEEVLGMVAVPL